MQSQELLACVIRQRRFVYWPRVAKALAAATLGHASTIGSLHQRCYVVVSTLENHAPGIALGCQRTERCRCSGHFQNDVILISRSGVIVLVIWANMLPSDSSQHMDTRP